MIGKLFGGIIGLPRTTALGTGADPTKIVGSEGRKIANLSRFPTKTSPQSVVTAAKAAGAAEAQSYLLAKESKHRLRTASALVQTMKTRADYAKGMMQVEQQVQQIGASHNKAIARYQLGTEETAASLTGYEAEFTRAGDVIDF